MSTPAVERDRVLAVTGLEPSLLRKSELSPRAPRLQQGEVPSVSTVKFPWGLETRLLNISNTGVLFESGTRIPQGSRQELKLCGPGTEIEIPAWFVRSEVAIVNGLGVKYHIAVMFETPLELDGAGQVSTAVVPAAKTLGSLLTQLGAELRLESSNRREAVEHAVRQAMGLRDVRIFEGLTVPPAAGDTLDFAVPASAPAILRITLAPDATPTEADLRLLHAASRLAAIVLEFEAPR